MRLTQKLLGYLHSAFDRDAHSFVAFRLRYDGAMSWSVSEGVLTTTVTGGSGTALSVDLSAYTVGTLATYLASRPGYSIVSPVGGAQAGISALVLMDGGGDIGVSNGDIVPGFTSLAWAYLETLAVELKAAQAQIVEMLKQTSIKTASGEWLDYHGRDHYNVPRLAGETDALYAARIIAEVLMPRGNNIAIARAISNATGGLPATVVDVASVVDGRYDGGFAHNGSTTYSALNNGNYGLFDVTFGMDLASDIDITPYIDRVKVIVERMRDAGTQMRQISFSYGMSDAHASDDADSGLALSITTAVPYDGRIRYDGSFTMSGTVTIQEVVT